MTYAGVKFCKVGGKVITQAGGKVFELVKDGGEVLLKEGREELRKVLTGPRLEPALAGPATRLPQAPNRDLLNVFFSKKTGTGGGSGKPAPRPEKPKVEKPKTEAPETEMFGNTGRAGRQKRLQELMNDDKLGSAERGWLKQEANAIKRDRTNKSPLAVGQKKRAVLRNPPGKELAHRRGFEAAKGYDHSHSNLQNKDLHSAQHKFDDKGKLNKNKGTKNEKR
jgi:hypothetical protein